MLSVHSNHFMKKYLLLLFSITSIIKADAQILCINCYHQNAGLATSFTNKVLNGGFEQNTCVANAYTSSYCPNSVYYSCTINNWICTDGGQGTYASIDDNTFCVTPEGSKAAYLGNGSFAIPCPGGWGDTSCFNFNGCEITNIPNAFPTNDSAYGSSSGVSIEQSISGLVAGNTYVLEFWAGGEPQTNGWTKPGIFAVDLGFGKNYFWCSPTGLGYTGDRFLIVFKATATTHTVKFTNWGHIGAARTEVILDDVRMYNYEELPAQYRCINSIADQQNAKQIYISNQDGKIQFTNLLVGSKVVITNLLGEKIIMATSNQNGVCDFDLSNQSKQLFVWQVLSENGSVVCGKLIE